MTCKECKHWLRATSYKWGRCLAPLPAWAEEADERGWNTVSDDSDLAQRCDLFVPRDA